ncbi:MAG TPA: hypothetical protein PLW65_08675, partial [Pseudomonadota bacterium]|nr:hypothetical protein [Pseudomonadota bacterium]
MSSINPPAGGAPPPPRDDEAVPVAIFDEQDTPLPPRAPMLVPRGALLEGLAAAPGLSPLLPVEEGSGVRPRPVELPELQLLRISQAPTEAAAEGAAPLRGEPEPLSASPTEAAVVSRGAERRGAAVFIAQPEVEGELQTLEPARLVGWAIATGFCGCLWLAPYGVVQPVGGPVDHPSSTPHRELYFEHGMLLGAYSTVLGDGIADVLAQAFSSRQAQRARSVVAGAPPRNLREQLSRLCRARLLDAKDASVRLHGYVVELVYRALAPTPGRYRLLPRTLTTGERVTPPVSPRLLLVE